MRKGTIVTLVLLTALLVGLFPQIDTSAATKNVTKTVTIAVGDTTKLKLKTNLTKSKWKTSNKNIAYVMSTNKTGAKVKGKKAGSATISVTYKNKTYKWKIIVKPLSTVKDKTVTLSNIPNIREENGNLYISYVNKSAKFTGKTLVTKPHKRGSAIYVTSYDGLKDLVGKTFKLKEQRFAIEADFTNGKFTGDFAKYYYGSAYNEDGSTNISSSGRQTDFGMFDADGNLLFYAMRIDGNGSNTSNDKYEIRLFYFLDEVAHVFDFTSNSLSCTAHTSYSDLQAYASTSGETGIAYTWVIHDIHTNDLSGFDYMAQLSSTIKGDAEVIASAFSKYIGGNRMYFEKDVIHGGND